MDELVQWLHAQLDEDERTARAAASYDDGAAHDVPGPPGTWTCLNESEWFGPSYRGGVIAPRIGLANAPELGAHIAAHNPARVLREIDAKRRITGLHNRTNHQCVAEDGPTQWHAKDPCTTLRLLALPYADRPGYKPEWRP